MLNILIFIALVVFTLVCIHKASSSKPIFNDKVRQEKTRGENMDTIPVFIFKNGQNVPRVLHGRDRFTDQGYCPEEWFVG